MCSDSAWPNAESVDEIWNRTQKMYFVDKSFHLLTQFPAELEERCWSGLQADPTYDAAREALFNVYRARIEHGNDIDACIDLKRLLDAVIEADPRFAGRVGRALLAALEEELKKALVAQGVSRDQFDEEPLSGIAAAFPHNADVTEPGHLVAGLLLAFRAFCKLRR